MLCSRKARKFAGQTQIVDEWVTSASPEDFETYRATLDMIESGTEDDWDRLPQGEILGTTQFGRMVTMMTNGDVIVWRCYADASPLYRVYYVGPASHFPS